MRIKRESSLKNVKIYFKWSDCKQELVSDKLMFTKSDVKNDDHLPICIKVFRKILNNL